MHEFVHRQNLMRYHKLLSETTSEARYDQLLKLLAEEEEYEQKLASSKAMVVSVAASVGTNPSG